ncbi:MAG: hypothetical protein KJ057_03145 [Phycisphaerae bacterium]|nr:hypothetical protein [Planctomycetia bacterium]MCK6463836.1 hypothetical protein [Phycisphaerae bacterium]MCL4717449.1 hypothetical protein [Phycisphaerae bacterium]NUQ07592.1 hypothetical protein [Phycisphaerae bacterium]
MRCSTTTAARQNARVIRNWRLKKMPTSDFNSIGLALLLVLFLFLIPFGY